MSRLTSILHAVWDIFGGPVIEFTYSWAHSLSVKIPSQLGWGAFVLIAVALSLLGLSLCDGGEVSNGTYRVP